MLNVVDKFDSYTEFEPYRLVVRSWILTLRQRTNHTFKILLSQFKIGATISQVESWLTQF